MLRETVTSMFQPCVYTVLTTIVAFMSLVVSGITPVIDFGWMMVVGLLIAFTVAFILIPSGLSVLPRPTPSLDEDNSSVFTLHFSRFTEKNGKLIVGLAVIAAIISVVGIQKLKVENRFIDYFHSSTEIYQGMLVIDQNLGGTISLDIIIDHEDVPEFMTDVAAEDNDFGGDAFTDDFGGDFDGGFDEVDEFGGDAFADDSVGFEDDDPFASDDAFGEAAQNVTSTSTSTFWFTQAGMEKIEAIHDYLDDIAEVGKVQSLAVAYKVARDLNGSSLNDFELALLRQALPDDIRSFLVDPYLNADIDQTRVFGVV